jgi:hypothetical protein
MALYSQSREYARQEHLIMLCFWSPILQH